MALYGDVLENRPFDFTKLKVYQRFCVGTDKLIKSITIFELHTKEDVNARSSVTSLFTAKTTVRRWSKHTGAFMACTGEKFLRLFRLRVLT
jgi:hypothetical protein